MLKVTIDGIETQVEPGTTILQAARKIATEQPEHSHLVPPAMCYYSPLEGSGGKCRTCIVKVTQGSERDPRPMPKPVASCQTQVMDGMVVENTTNPDLLAARKGVVELLLINHPLDCPVCDQAGECHLQDLAFAHGASETRYEEERRTFERIDIGPYIQLHMTRCILCYRCVYTANQFTDERVHGVLFTGSTEVGRLLMAQCAPTIKRLSLELGGNAPFIVFDDADLDAAIEGAMASKYRNSGQTCVCANRFLVQDGIYDRFAKALSERVAALKVGNGMEEGVEQGPLIEQKAVNRLRELIDDAVEHGASVLQGGQPHPLGGTYFSPTVLGDATPAMRVAREELFGPVAPLFRFKDEAEAIAMANDTEYGLAAYLFTRDNARAWRMGEALEYGMVGVNTGLISNEVAPFGGVKQSGLGREGSRYGIDEYLEIKYMCQQL